MITAATNRDLDRSRKTRVTVDEGTYAVFHDGDMVVIDGHIYRVNGTDVWIQEQGNRLVSTEVTAAINAGTFIPMRTRVYGVA